MKAKVLMNNRRTQGSWSFFPCAQKHEKRARNKIRRSDASHVARVHTSTLIVGGGNRQCAATPTKGVSLVHFRMSRDTRLLVTSLAYQSWTCPVCVCLCKICLCLCSCVCPRLRPCLCLADGLLTTLVHMCSPRFCQHGAVVRSVLVRLGGEAVWAFFVNIFSTIATAWCQRAE